MGTDSHLSINFVLDDGRLTADDPDAAGDVYVYDADADELMRISASQGGVV